MKPISGMDVLFVCGETPSWHMHVCGVVVVDPTTAPGEFTPETLQTILADRLVYAPQFSWKLQEAPFGLLPPVFVSDPHFDLPSHFHRVALPAPGGNAELAEVIGQVAGRKLDRDRPLWEVWTIEGLASGHMAVMTKIHHSMIDGVSGVDLAALMMDLSPESRPMGQPASKPTERGQSPVAWFGRGVQSALEAPVRAARYGGQLVRQGLVLGRSLLDQTPAALPFQAPPTSFNQRLTPHRTFAFSQVPLGEVKRVKEATGVKMNDVVLALVADALRSYLASEGGLPARPLVAQVPISLRTEATRSEIGTLVGTMFASLATDLDDPIKRLMAIHRSTQAGKQMRRGFGADRKISLADVIPAPLVRLFAHAYSDLGLEAVIPPAFNLIVSNVAGPSFDLYIGGARVVAVFPLGPLLYGSGLNATVFSLGEQMNFGFLACPEEVPEPWRIADGIPAALEQLGAAVSLGQAA
jgi:WS/DGAT/MGAT family acyltransferase